MRRYYLHTRHHGIFYAEILDPQSGRKLTARSTGTKDHDEAMLKVAAWLSPVSLPAGNENPVPWKSLPALTGLSSLLKKQN
jgi:hypothetical protein